MGKNTMTTLSNGKYNEGTADKTAGGGNGGESITLPTAEAQSTDVKLQPTTLPFYSGISFTRDSTIGQNDNDDDDDEDVEADETSSDSDEYNDEEDDYEDYFLNDIAGNEETTLTRTTATTADGNLASYRSEESGETSSANAVTTATTTTTKKEAIHDFLKKHTSSDAASSGDG